MECVGFVRTSIRHPANYLEAVLDLGIAQYHE
eukprot:COSAG02_NODE_30876_length_543_cov_1.608108_1_plen_31_part_01